VTGQANESPRLSQQRLGRRLRLRRSWQRRGRRAIRQLSCTPHC